MVHVLMLANKLQSQGFVAIILKVSPGFMDQCRLEADLSVPVICCNHGYAFFSINPHCDIITGSPASFVEVPPCELWQHPSTQRQVLYESTSHLPQKQN